MAQVQDALSYIGGGQHTVEVDVNWQLREYVRGGLDETQDLATVLTITGEQDKAYACSCENYVKFAWGKNISIPEFFRALIASEFISSAKARKYHLSDSSDINYSLQHSFFCSRPIYLPIQPTYRIR